MAGRVDAARRRVPHLLALIVLVCAGVGAAVAGFLCYPQIVFAHEVSSGRLTLHSDRPFDPRDGRGILDDADLRLRRSGLRQGEGRHHVFIAHADWRQRLTFLWSYGVGGVNYYPLTRNVFLRDADIGRRLLISPLGTPLAPPRTLAYFVAHEVAHSLTGEMLGPVAYARLPVWIRGGVADYAALAGTGVDDLDAMAKRYLAGDDPAFDYARSGLYTRYRFLVTYLVERMGSSIEALLLHPMEQGEAEALVRARLRGSSA